MLTRGIKGANPKGKCNTVSWDEHRTSNQKSEFEPCTTLLCKLQPASHTHFTEEGSEALRDLSHTELLRV